MLTIEIQSNHPIFERAVYVQVDEAQFEKIRADVLPVLEETNFACAVSWDKDQVTHKLLDEYKDITDEDMEDVSFGLKVFRNGLIRLEWSPEGFRASL
jgi:hypothetical protein